MLLRWKTKYPNSSDWDIFIETEFEKSDLTDLLNSNHFNLCPVLFVHFSTTGTIFLTRPIIRIWLKYVPRLVYPWSRCQIRDFSNPDSISVGIWDFQAKSEWFNSLVRIFIVGKFLTENLSSKQKCLRCHLFPWQLQSSGPVCSPLRKLVQRYALNYS